MIAIIDHLISWPAFYLLIGIFVVDLILDHYFSSISVFEILPTQIRAYILAVPLSIALTCASIIPLPMISENLYPLIFISFSPFVLLIASYYKDKLSDLSDDEDYESHWLMKLGLLLMVLASLAIFA